MPQVNKGKYLGLYLDARLRWTEHIKFLRSRSVYINILKWLVDKSWDISPSQAVSFVTSTIIAQLLWGSFWYINVARSHFRALDSIASSAYKIVTRSASNKTCWTISAQPTIKHRITVACDKYILKSFQLKKSIIINKIISNWMNRRGLPKDNLPFLIQWWNEHLTPNLHVWSCHPHYEFPLRPLLEDVKFNFSSGVTASETGACRH